MSRKKPKRCPTTGKFMYPTREAAVDGAIGSVRDRCNALRIYTCPDCGHFHLTKRIQSENPKAVPTVRPFTPNDLARIIERKKKTA